jgi:hypothetical protein
MSISTWGCSFLLRILDLTCNGVAVAVAVAVPIAIAIVRRFVISSKYQREKIGGRR